MPAATRGFDMGKKVDGHKRFLVVDALGLLLAMLVVPASTHDTASRQLLAASSRTGRSWLLSTDGMFPGSLVDWGTRPLRVRVQTRRTEEAASERRSSAVLADLHRQRIRLHEPIRAGVQRPGAERLSLGSETLCRLRDLRRRDVRRACRPAASIRPADRTWRRPRSVSVPRVVAGPVASPGSTTRTAASESPAQASPRWCPIPAPGTHSGDPSDLRIPPRTPPHTAHRPRRSSTPP
ncbi:hypothetical protein FRAHR75_330035 [Frankia sp. Hr75.2]|nr:hypothetical protein FRAHR75_330035 [Frankia sp. Hr75.2]